MKFILTLIGAMLLLDVAWWLVSVRLAPRRALRWAIAVFMAAQMGGLGWILTNRNSSARGPLTKAATALVYNWHFLGLSLVLLLAAPGLPLLLAARLRRTLAPSSDQDAARCTRRDFVKIAAVVTPPLATLGLTGLALAQLKHFRIRRIELPIPGLPPALDGLTIAHVSDMHVGRFTSGPVLREIVDATNNLRADLVLLTGDLINSALADLPSALDHVRKMEARGTVCLIEGNHDLIEDAEAFEQRMAISGLPFLLDDTLEVRLRGVPVQLLGLRWVRRSSGGRDDYDQRTDEAVRQLAAQRHLDAFPILLAHHPHAFDPAAALDLPLTLAGHTHGGQLMLNEALGAGPAIFRYWSGVYSQGDSRLVVSNGVGNWFPIRINAPAEIIHLTLRPAAAHADP